MIENVGPYNTNAIIVTVSSDDEYISMINSSSGIAYAIAGAIVATETPVSFSVSGDVPDGHIAQFESTLSDGEDEWHITFGIEVHAPVFEIANPIIMDENMDGVWDAGESATITVDLANSGSANFGNNPGAVISTDNPYVTILSGENDNTFYGIGANDAYEGEFLVQADISTPMATVVDFNISGGYSPSSECETNDCVEQANLIYSVIIGHPSILVWDPSDDNVSGDRLVIYFESIGFNGYDYVTSTDLPELENYMTALWELFH